jgi:phage terminase large subunit
MKAQIRVFAQRALDRWVANPRLFAREVLRTEVWSRQAELLESIVHHAAVACRSGHKTGKTTALAIIALWWVCTRWRARVILTAASHRQVEKVLWKEIRRLYRRAAQRTCSACGGTRLPCSKHPDAPVRRAMPIGGDMHESAEAGLQFADGREIIGFSTKEPERMAGFSGPNMLYIVDEASGVPDEIFEAIEGNRAGGAYILIISNPTQTSGVFYEAFTSDRSEWCLVHISSKEVADEVAAGKFPRGTGLATPEWVAERLRVWGVDDPRYQVRVLGEFPRVSDEAMIGLGLVEAAKKRWTPKPPTTGRTQLGVDVAWTGKDSSVIAWSRGPWATIAKRLKGNDPVDVAEAVLAVARDVRLPGEKPIVRVDTSNMGAGVYAILKRSDEVEVIGMLAAESATVEGFSRLRDQAWGAFETWLMPKAKGGIEGAIPSDPSLIADIVAPKRGTDIRSRVKVESKKEIRKRIGRSTDEADALVMAVFPTPKTNNYDDVYAEIDAA